MNQPRSLLRTVGSISSATSLSRVLGLVRLQVQSYYFGAGPLTDAFQAAFRIPNLLRDLFAEGAMSSAFVPTFTAEREKRGAEAAWRLANGLITALTLILGAVTVSVFVGAPWILRVYVPGFSPEKMDLAVSMTRILSPFLLFVALAAVAMGVLNTCGRFFLPALAPASFNVAAILAVVLLVPVLPRFGVEPALALAIGALAGGLLQFAVQIPAMRREGFRFRLELAFRDPALRRVGWLMLPATFGLAATQINILVDTVLASSFGDGPMTYLVLAFRLMQLPIGVFGVAIGTANLARVSRDAAHGDTDAMRGNLAAALRIAAMLTLPASFGLIALRTPIVRLLFEHGRFGAEDTARTAGAVLCYSVGLFAYAVTKIQVPTFYALGNRRTPVLASAASVSAKIAASFLFIALFRRLGVDPFLGLALSTSLAAWINFGWLSFGIRKQLGSLRGERLVSTTLKMLALSALMGGLASWVHGAVEVRFGGGGLAGEIGRLGTAIACALAFLALGLRVLDLPETRGLLSRWRGRRS
jgi:putative peptidoglycan lipid II flippase